MTLDVLMYNVPVPLKLAHVKLGTIVFIDNIYYYVLVDLTVTESKKFRKRGNKEGALRAFCQLEEDELGKVLEVTRSKGSVCVSGNDYL